MAIEAVTLTERPDLRSVFGRFHLSGWPQFMLHDAVSNRLWNALYGQYPDFQLVLLEDTEPVAIGNTMPVRWDGTVEDLPDGVRGVLARTMDERQKPSALSAMAAIVSPDHRGQGVSALVLEEMRLRARQANLSSLIAPVRPTLKDRYPLIPMEQYIEWRRDDGSRFDPWLRVHERLGAKILSVAPRSMNVTGTVAEWEEWSEMTFPSSGRHIVPGALSPVEIDIERDRGVYVEQNVRMLHQ